MTKLHYLLQQLTQKLAEHQFMHLIMQINPNKDNNNMLLNIYTFMIVVTILVTLTLLMISMIL